MAVLDSLDVMTQVLDWLEAPTVFGARATSSTFRAAGDKVPGRLSMKTFDSISASMFYRGHWERDEGYDSDASYGSMGPPVYWVVDECSIDGYDYPVYDQNINPKDNNPQEDDLKHLIALVEPEIMISGWYGATPFAAPNGKWFTVGDLFDAIAKNEKDTREGPSDHTFFEGVSVCRRDDGRVLLSPMWGS